MKKEFFVIVAIFVFFSFNPAVFAGGSSAEKNCPPGVSACGDIYSMDGGINYTGIPSALPIAQTTTNVLDVKEVSVRSNRAKLHFKPGAIKYVAEYKNNKAVLHPKKASITWGEGALGVGSLHTFRSLGSEEGEFDEIWISSKYSDLEKEDIHVKLSAFFQDGTVDVKKIRITKGSQKVVSISSDEIVFALQPETKKN